MKTKELEKLVEKLLEDEKYCRMVSIGGNQWKN